VTNTVICRSEEKRVEGKLFSCAAEARLTRLEKGAIE
jgi:hypothetical protein